MFINLNLISQKIWVTNKLLFSHFGGEAKIVNKQLTNPLLILKCAHFQSWWIMSICSFIKCKYLFLILFWAFCPQLLSYRLCDWHFNSLRIAYLRTLSIEPNSIDTNPVPLGHSCRCSTPCYLMTIVLGHFGRQRSAAGP